MLCTQFNCKLSEQACIKRQTVDSFDSIYRYCQSGQCEQGRALSGIAPKEKQVIHCVDCGKELLVLPWKPNLSGRCIRCSARSAAHGRRIDKHHAQEVLP